MTEVIKKKMEGPPRHLIQSRDIKLLRLNSLKHARRLRYLISRKESKCSFRSPSTSFYTPSANGDINPLFDGVPRTFQRSISEHTNTLKIQKHRRPESLHNTIPLRPADLFYNYSQLDFDGKKDFPKAASFSLNSPALASVYSTPPDSASYFHNPGEILAFDKTASWPTQMSTTDNLDQLDEQKPHSANADTDNLDQLDEQKSHSANADTDIKFNLCQKSFSFEPRTTIGDENFLQQAADVNGRPNRRKRPLRLQRLKLPGTLEFTPNTDSPISSENNTLSTETDFWQGTASTSQANGANSGCRVLSPVTVKAESHDPDITAKNIRPRQKMKTHPPPNPFFAKAFFMRSPHNSSSTSSSSLVSSDAGSDDGSFKAAGEISDHSQYQDRPSNCTESNHNVNEILDKQPPQHDSDVCSSTNKPSGTQPPSECETQQPSETQPPSECETQPPSSSEASPEIFTLAPEAFRSDGTPVFDRQEAKMFYESVKDKRKLFRRQSTVSSSKGAHFGGCPSVCEDIHEQDGSSDNSKLDNSSDKQNLPHPNTDFSRTATEERTIGMEKKMKTFINTEVAPVSYVCGVDFDICDLSQFSEAKDL